MSHPRRPRPLRGALQTIVASPSVFSPQAILLTVPETAIIARRRERHLGLPDDVHVVASERIESLLGIIAAFAGKSLLIKHPRMAPVRDFLVGRRLVLATVLSGLSPLRPLFVPLLRLFRPLQVALTPFWAMSVPVLVYKCESAVRAWLAGFLAARTPAAAAHQIGGDVRTAVEMVHSKIEARREELLHSVDTFLHVIKTEFSSAAGDRRLRDHEDAASGVEVTSLEDVHR